MKQTGKASKSLIRTLAWRLVLFTVVVILIALGILGYRLSGTASSVRHSSLIAQADEIARSLQIDANGVPRLVLPDAVAHAYAGHGKDFAYTVLDEAGAVLFSSPPRDRPLDGVSEGKAGSGISYFRLRHPSGGQPVYGASISFGHGGRSFRVQVAQAGLHNGAILDAVVDEFFETSGWGFIALLVILLGVNVVTIGRSLRPLRAALMQAKAIDPTALDVRLRENGIPSEILPLMQAVNSALDRLEKGFLMQREFTADAAHELRSPLAVLTARIDKLRNRDEAAALRADVRVMNRIVGQLLKVAQLETLVVHEDERADLSAVVIEVAAFLGGVAIDQGKSISAKGVERPVIVRGDHESLVHAIRNLVENALHHTPEGTTVEISVREDGLLCVADRGPGIPPDLRDKVFQRFWRADHSGTGAGLGLAIVERIVKAHGGGIEIAYGPGDEQERLGALFIIRLPVAPETAPAVS